MAKHLQITGIVQGVGYRAGFESQARALNLSGWVRNRLDGSVEAMICGDEDALQRLIDWARQGPRTARVNHVKVSEAPDAMAAQQAFSVLPTA